MPLLGNRILLRALEHRDLDPIWEAYKDLDLELVTSGDSPPYSDRWVRNFWGQRIDDPAPDMRYFAIEPLPGNPGAGVFAGMCNLQDIDTRNRHAELGIWMASRDLRGLGYGTDAIRALLPYAFEVTLLEKLHLGVYDFNEGGMRSYERVGFRYEGRLRHMIYYEGRWWDEWPMRILRSEWEHIRQPPADGGSNGCFKSSTARVVQRRWAGRKPAKVRWIAAKAAAKSICWWINVAHPCRYKLREPTSMTNGWPTI